MTGGAEERTRWLRFGAFEANLETGELSRQGRRIRLADKSFQVLAALLERPGELVTRDELRLRLWGEETFVDFDDNLNAAVSRLREALHDPAQGPRFIETIPRRGYRFVGPPPVPAGTEGTARPGARSAIPLSSLVGGALLLALLGFGIWWILRDPGPAVDAHPRTMLAVLPLQLLAADTERAFVAEGLTDELITRLVEAAPARLGVIARSSVRRYRDSPKTIREIGRELEVDYVIEGSLRPEEGQLRITIQLVRVADQTHLWARSYDRELARLLDLQAEVARDVVEAVLPELTGPVRTEAPSVREGALLEYLAGRAELTGEDVASSRRAAEHFELAVEADPEAAHAWAGLARAWSIVWFGVDSADEAGRISLRSREAAERALALEPDLPEARYALALAAFFHRWDPASAVAILHPELSGPPTSADALRLGAAALSATSRPEEATVAALDALPLDPASPDAGASLGWHYLFADQPSNAFEVCQVVVERAPESTGGVECLYQALLQLERDREAIAVLEAGLLASGAPEHLFRDLDREDPAGVRGIERVRLRLLQATEGASSFELAAALVSLDEEEEALEALAAALAEQLPERDSRLLYLAVDPRFDPLRQDPRFGEILRRIEAQGGS